MIKENKIKTVFTATDATSRVLSKIQNRITSMAARASLSMKKMTAATNKVARGMTSILKYGFAAGAGAAVGLYMAIDKTAERMASLGEFTKSINFPIEEFQQWRFAAEQSGISTEEFESSLANFTKGFSSAKFGAGTMAAGLKQINPALLKTMNATKSSADAFGIYIQAMRDAKTPAEQNALAVAGFGRSAAAMTLLAKESAIGIEALKNEMIENGIITQEQSEAADKYTDTVARLKSTISGLMVTALSPLLPILADVANGMRQWFVSNKQLIASKLKEYVIWLIDHADDILKWGKRIAIVIAAFYAFVAAVNVLNAALIVLSSGLLTNPFFWIAVGVVAALVAIYIFRDEINAVMYKFFDLCVELGNSLREYFWALVDVFQQAMSPLSAFFENSFAIWGSIVSLFVDIWNNGWIAVAQRFVAVWDFIKSYYLGIWNTILSVPFTVWEAMKAIGSFFVDLWNGNWDAIGARFTAVWNGIKATAGAVIDWIINKFGPLGALLQKWLNVPKAITGDINVVPDVAPMFEQRKPGEQSKYDMWGLQKSDAEMKSSSGLGDYFKKYSDMIKNPVPVQSESFGPPRPQVARERVHAYTPDELEYYLKEEKVERAEITIRDKTGRTIVTRGKLPRGTKLVHSGAM